jgi:hypothetical protein
MFQRIPDAGEGFEVAPLIGNPEKGLCFPNEASLLRLVSAILMEVSEERESTDKAYLKMKAD